MSLKRYDYILKVNFACFTTNSLLWARHKKVGILRQMVLWVTFWGIALSLITAITGPLSATRGRNLGDRALLCIYVLRWNIVLWQSEFSLQIYSPYLYNFSTYTVSPHLYTLPMIAGWVITSLCILVSNIVYFLPTICFSLNCLTNCHGFTFTMECFKIPGSVQFMVTVYFPRIL